MIKVTFGKNVELREDALWIFPFEVDVSRLMLTHLGADEGLLGWFALPLRQFIRDAFAQTFPQWEPLTPATRFALAHRIIMESGFLSELGDRRSSVGVAEAFVEFAAACDEAGILTDAQIGSIAPRDDARLCDMLELYRRFRRELGRMRLATDGDMCTMLAEAIEDGAEPRQLAGKDRVVFRNFVEFSVPQRRLVLAMGERWSVEISFPLPLGDYPESWRALPDGMLADLGIGEDALETSPPRRHWLSEALRGNPERACEALAADGGLPECGFFRLPDQQREAEFVARIAKYLAAEHGIPPCRMEVVCPDPGLYAPELAAAFDGAGLPHDFDKFTRTPASIASLFTRLLRVLRSGWRRAELLAMLSHPLARKNIAQDGKRIVEKAARKQIVTKDDWMADDTKELDVIRRLIRSLEVLEGKCSGRELPRVVEEVIGALGVEDAISSLGDDELRAHLSLELESLREASFELGRGYGETEADATLFISALLHVARPKRGTKGSGVRLLGVEEGRGEGADIRFFVGFETHRFPERHKKNPLLRREYTDFLPFVSRMPEIGRLSLLQGMLTAKRFFLTFPMTSPEGDTTAALPVDEMLHFCLSPEGGDSVVDVASKRAAETAEWLDALTLTQLDKKLAEPKAPPEVKASFEPVVAKLGGSISVSKLEEYGKCHYRLALEEVVGEVEPPAVEEGVSYARLGEALHRALFRFFRKRFVETFGMEPLKQADLLSGGLADFVERFGLSRLDAMRRFAERVAVTPQNIALAAKELHRFIHEALDELVDAGEPFSQTDLLEYRDGYDLDFVRRLLEAELELAGRGLRLPVGFEVEIKLPCPVLEAGLYITGKVDRIDLLEGGAISIVDYKSGRPSKVLKNSGTIDPEKEFQLQAYAYLFSRAGVNVREIAYLWNLGSFSPSGASALSLGNETLGRIEEKLLKLLSDLMAFDFTPSPDACFSCPYQAYCPRR